MHELSIASQIGELVKKEAFNKNATRITNVVLEIGELAGIEIDALKFAWTSIQSDELLKNTSMTVKLIEGIAICAKCQKEFVLHDFFELCPECQGFENKITQGKDLIIKSIDIEC